MSGEKKSNPSSGNCSEEKHAAQCACVSANAERLVQKRPFWRRIVSAPFLGIIRFYQRFLSPLKPPTCRYFPSCSAYAHAAIVQHGAAKGGYLAGTRILRCSPLFPGGFDPVPESLQEQRLLNEGKLLVNTQERKARLGAEPLQD